MIKKTMKCEHLKGFNIKVLELVLVENMEEILRCDGID